MEVLQHMESTLKLYVYGGKLVKLLKKYDEMFSKDFTVSSNKFAYEIEFWGTGQAVYCLDNKGELVHLLTEFLREMVQVYEHNFDLEKINCGVVCKSEEELYDNLDVMDAPFYKGFYDKFCALHDGKSTEKIIDYLLSKNEKPSKNRFKKFF